MIGLPNSNDVILKSNLHSSRVKSIFLFGSRIYETNDLDSDWDFKVISNTSKSNVEIKIEDYNIHILTADSFQSKLDAHDPVALECFFSPSRFKILNNNDFTFNLKIPTLRHSFSHVSSNSWVKSKKKLELGEYNIGIKSIFHSLRIPIFGSQILKEGKITDFTEANFIWEKLKTKSNWSWQELDKEFRNLRNSIMTDFRKNSFK
jgi:predicted nucleotidyltransferase